eukprot:a676514_291.p1 GENE.a676514_291~~a676514_291.p1  ORF type:complete len:152 (-),score=40.00 a676514_291:147-554(-)
MPIYSVFIVNKAGGMIYSVHFEGYRKNFADNDCMMLCGYLYAMFNIISELSPVPGSSGLQEIQAPQCRLACFQTMTGTKFFVTGSHDEAGLRAFLDELYLIFVHYVLKNPFYEDLEQPIKCNLFAEKLHALVARF